MITPLPPAKAPGVFRIVVWNVASGFPAKFARLLSLEPDVAIVPEACNEAELRKTGIDRFSSMAWIGRYHYKGLAVMGFGASKVRMLSSAWDQRLEWVLPVTVMGPLPFTLFGIMAYNAKSTIPFSSANWDIQPGMVLDVYPDIVREGNWVLAGDCNHHPVFDKHKPRWDFSSLIEAYAGLGMTNAWHALHGVPVGHPSEPPTHWNTWNPAKPYHLDYCFLPESLRDRLLNVWVGHWDHWGAIAPKSDHAPLVVDLAI